MKIKLIDISLAHIKENKYDLIEWDRNPVTNDDNLIVFTDNKLESVDDYKDYNGIKIAWIIEPQLIIPTLYSWIVGNYKKFDYVLVHHKWLLNIDDRFRLITLGGCWVYLQDHKVYKKTKMTSIIASDKTRTEGHQMRHNCISRCKNKLDVYGIKYNYIKEKIDGLKDYRFSIAIENAREDAYFTEKLIDCFATGTIPIYWGCPCIGNFFNTDGMLICEDENHIVELVNNVTLKDYTIREEAIKENLELAKNHLEYECIYNGIKELNL